MLKILIFYWHRGRGGISLPPRCLIASRARMVVGLFLSAWHRGGGGKSLPPPRPIASQASMVVSLFFSTWNSLTIRDIYSFILSRRLSLCIGCVLRMHRISVVMTVFLGFFFLIIYVTLEGPLLVCAGTGRAPRFALPNVRQRCHGKS